MGDEAFIVQVQKHISEKQSDSVHITKRSKKSPKRAIDEIISTASGREDAMRAIYETGHYTMFEIAQFYDVHYSTVSRAIRSLRAKCNDWHLFKLQNFQIYCRVLLVTPRRAEK